MAHLPLFKKIWWAITIHIVLLTVRYLIFQIQSNVPFAHPSTAFSFSCRHTFVSSGNQTAPSGMPCLVSGVKKKIWWNIILSLKLIHDTQEGKLCLWSAVAVGDTLRYNFQRDSGHWVGQSPPALVSLHMTEHVCTQGTWKWSEHV